MARLQALPLLAVAVLLSANAAASRGLRQSGTAANPCDFSNQGPDATGISNPIRLDTDSFHYRDFDTVMAVSESCGFTYCLPAELQMTGYL